MITTILATSMLKNKTGISPLNEALISLSGIVNATTAIKSSL